jgi:hypothetical protein
VRWVLVAVLLLAAWIRIWRLPSMPKGLSQDEIVNAGISLERWDGPRVPFLRGGFGHEPLFHQIQGATLKAFGDNVMGIRMPAVFIGLLLTATTYTVLTWMVNEVTGLAAAVGMAVSWWPMIYSRIGIRAIALPLLLTLAIGWGWRGILTRSRSWLLGSGLLLGLVFYTYSASWMVVGLALGWLGYGLLFHLSWVRRNWRALLGVGLIATAVVLPLVVYLAKHPELGERYQQLGGPLDALMRGDASPIFRSIAATLGMVSASLDARWTYARPGSPAFGLVGQVLVYLGLIQGVRRFRHPAYGLLSIWLGVMLIPSMVTPDAPSSIRAIGALPAVCGFLGVGASLVLDWAHSFEHAFRKELRTVLYGVLIGAGLLELGLTYSDLRTWSAHSEVYWLYKAHFYEIAQFLDDPPPTVPSPVEDAVVFESWVDPIDVDGVRRNLAHDGRVPRWTQRGEAFVWPAASSRFVIAVPVFTTVGEKIWERTMADARQVATGTYRMPNGKPGVVFYLASREPTLSETLDAVRDLPVDVPEQEGAGPIQRPVDFGGQIQFHGYDILNADGDTLSLLTLWEVTSEISTPLKIFIHLLDQENELVSQYDGLDVWLPATRPGDHFIQLHSMPYPDGCEGGCGLQLGLYNPYTLDRIPIVIEGEHVSDRLILADLD